MIVVSNMDELKAKGFWLSDKDYGRILKGFQER